MPKTPSHEASREGSNDCSEGLNLKVSRVRVIARHQCGEAVMTAEDDVSGEYVIIKRQTLYSPGRSMFIDLHGMDNDRRARLLAGQHVSIGAGRFS